MKKFTDGLAVVGGGCTALIVAFFVLALAGMTFTAIFG